MPLSGPDRWQEYQDQLQNEGWIFYSTARYRPTLIRGYSSAFVSGSPAAQRKGNRPTYVRIAPAGSDESQWTGVMRMGATVLYPWVAGAVMPPDDADWLYAANGHFLADGSFNPVVDQELVAAETSPVASVTRVYGDCSDPATCLAAIRDLYSRIAVP